MGFASAAPSRLPPTRTMRCFTDGRMLILWVLSACFLIWLFASRSMMLEHAQSHTDAGSCPPRAYAAGHWAPHPRTAPNNGSLTHPEDVFMHNGFSGCASSREVSWHLGADDARQWDRFPRVASYDWVPGAECTALRALDGAALVRDLVENGGWLLIGDSVTENHFFSLSCTLFPHVRAEPTYDGGAYDHGWPQHLFLAPESPLVPTLAFPPGFSIAHTPLVTFRRADVLLTKPQLAALHGTPEDALFDQDVALWTLGPAACAALLAAPLPDARYRALVLSSAGHWTTRTFAGLPDMRAVLALFARAAAAWADEVEGLLQAHRSVQPGALEPVVLVRAYLPGHVDCATHREAWDAYVEPPADAYNWAQIGAFNDLFEELLADGAYPHVHFLPLDRPGRLRPDAHVSTDCLHVMAGAGVAEGWTQYISHFLSRELGPEQAA